MGGHGGLRGHGTAETPYRALAVLRALPRAVVVGPLRERISAIAAVPSPLSGQSRFLLCPLRGHPRASRFARNDRGPLAQPSEFQMSRMMTHLPFRRSNTVTYF